MKSPTNSTMYDAKEWRTQLITESAANIKRSMHWNSESVINKIIASRKTLSPVPISDRELSETEAIYTEIFAEFHTRILKRFVEEFE